MPDDCHAQACAIQSCLAKNSYDEAKCQSQIDALYNCCNAFYESNGDMAKTVSCPQARLLRLKMKERGKGKREDDEKEKDVTRSKEG